MLKENLSRRDFMAALAATGTTATLASAALAQPQAGAVVVSSYPVVEPKPSQETIKILCVERLTPAEAEKIRASGKNVDLVLLRDRSELKEKAADDLWIRTRSCRPSSRTGSAAQDSMSPRRNRSRRITRYGIARTL